ncbi:MAG: pseudouridine synthase [Deltaproteobacteria bacterium]|nr:MAG: pseudouridine synthase [Deltaproteobacteria bacterium]
MVKGEKRLMRLNKVIAEAGITSRRKADRLIEQGRVFVNGKPAKIGMKVIWGKDVIKVDGKRIPDPPEKVYIMLNKPFGYISSLKDPGGRPVVVELLPKIQQRVFPVGRLDFDTMGLMLFTNDGELAYRLTHPKYQVPRTYKATVRGRLSYGAIQKIRNGIVLEDGPVRKVKIKLLQKEGLNNIVRITVYEGRSRLIKRIFEAVGCKVVHLIRIGFANLVLGDLKVGHYRYLEKQEVESLKRFVGLRSR